MLVRPSLGSQTPSQEVRYDEKCRQTKPIRCRQNRPLASHKTREQNSLWQNKFCNRADRNRSGDDLFDHSAGDIGQPEVAAIEAEGQPGVLQTEQGQDGGVEVVDADAVFDRPKANVVSRAIVNARLYAATGQPGGEAVG